MGAAAWLWGIVAWRIAPLSAPALVPGGGFVLVVLYYGWATARNYHTLGQGFAGLTLARTDYRPLTTRRAYWRMVLFMLTGGMILPNAVVMLFDKKRRTIHDLLTKTWVYAVPEYDRRKRIAACAAAGVLALVGSARLALSVTDRLELMTRPSMADVAAGGAGLPDVSTAAASGPWANASPAAIAGMAAAEAARREALQAYDKTLRAIRPVPDFRARELGDRFALDSFACWRRPTLFYFFPAEMPAEPVGRTLAALRERDRFGQLCLVPVPLGPGSGGAPALAETARRAYLFRLLRLSPDAAPAASSSPVVLAYTRAGARTTLDGGPAADPRAVAAFAGRLVDDGAPEAAVSLRRPFRRSADEPELAAVLSLEKEAAAMIGKSDFAGLDILAAELRASRARGPHGDRLLARLYDALTGAGSLDELGRQARARALQDWIAARPRSITPRVALAALRLGEAEEARGGEFASGETPAERERYEERLKPARETLEQAQVLKESCPELYVQLLRLGLDDDWTRERLEETLRRGAALDAGYPRLYRMMSYYFRPQLHGAVGEWEGFIASATARVGGDDGAVLYADLTLAEMREGRYGLGGSRIFDATRLSWPSARQGLVALLKRDRGSRYAQNWLALLACAAGDRKTAAAVFKRIGDDFVVEVWSNRVNYEHYRRWAGARG